VPRKILTSLLVILLAAMWGMGPAASVSVAQSTDTWTGTVNNDWTNGQNWADGETPEDGDIVYLATDHNGDIINVPSLFLSALYMETTSLSGPGTLSVGALVWTRGDIEMSLTVGGPGLITGEVTFSHGSGTELTTLTNNGAMAMGPGAILHDDFGAEVVNNDVWAASRVGNDNTIQSNVCCEELAVFQNNGKLSANGAAKLRFVRMGFDGTGASSVEGQVVLDYGTHILDDGMRVDGNGTDLSLVDKAMVTANGTIWLADGAVITQNGGELVPGAKPLVLKGTGDGGTYRWLAGTITANPTFADKTSLVLDSSGAKLLGNGDGKHGILTLGTTATQSGTGKLELWAARIVNNGTWTVPAGQNVTIAGTTCCASPSQFRNFAKLSIDPSSTMTFSNDQFANASQATISGGNLVLSGGVHLIRNGSTLTGAKAAIKTTGRAVVDGSGDLTLHDGGTFLLGGGSQMTGTFDLKGTGTFLWSEGMIGGIVDTGTGVKTRIDDVTTDHAHDRAISTAGPKGAAQLVVEGGAVQHSVTPISLGAGVEVTNRIGSTWEIDHGGFSGSVCCASPAKFINLGTLDIEAATPVSLGELQFWNRGSFTVGSGSVRFSGTNPTQFAGATTDAGTIVASEFDLQGGDFTGAGAVTGNLSNTAGDLQPGSPIGTLKVSGTYTQGASGKFTADLTSGRNDMLVAQTADLGGTLALRLAQPMALPKRAYQLVRAKSVEHPFTVTTGLTTLGGPWKVVTSGTSIGVRPG
jgi:hypothetical protein